MMTGVTRLKEEATREAKPVTHDLTGVGESSAACRYITRKVMDEQNFASRTSAATPMCVAS